MKDIVTLRQKSGIGSSGDRRQDTEVRYMAWAEYMMLCKHDASQGEDGGGGKQGKI